MGTEVVACCTQTLVDDDTVDTSLEEQAKLIHDIEEDSKSTTTSPILQHICDIPPGLPSKSTINSRRKSALQKYKKHKPRRQRLNHLSLEQELEDTELELLLQKQAIKLLRKQNEFLRQQNEKFLSQYGSHFASKSTYTNSNQSFSISNHGHSLSLTSIISNTSQISYSQSTNNSNQSQKPESPLTPLTNKQTKIILSYTMDNENENKNGVVNKVRSCSVPTFNENVNE